MARAVQRERYASLALVDAEGGEAERGANGTANGPAIRTNADADGELLEKVAGPDAAGRELLTQAIDRLKLSARGYHRVLRVARTLADLDGADGVTRVHVAEALSYRRLAPGR